MQDRCFPNAVDGKTGAGIRKHIAGADTKRDIRKSPKAFPFHAAERSARECRGTMGRMDNAPIRRRK